MERERKRKREKYRNSSEAEKKIYSEKTMQRQKARVEAMNEKDRLEYAKRRSAWQRGSYARVKVDRIRFTFVLSTITLTHPLLFYIF